MVDLEAGAGEHASLDLAQDLAHLVHGLVHSHDWSPCRPLQPPMLAICTSQHAVNQLPAGSVDIFYYEIICFLSICFLEYFLKYLFICFFI